MNHKPETGNQAVITSLFTILLLLLAPSVALPGVINTKIDLSCAVDKKNDIAVHAEIANKGNSTAYKVTLSLFMEDWAQKFDSLGDNPPDGMLKFNEKISLPELKPGLHILVARVSFEEQNGTSHRIHEYFPFSYKMQNTDKEPELSLELKTPLFNSRAFFETKKKMEISMNNSGNSPFSPVISFFLADGYTAGDASIQTRVPPDNKIMESVFIEKEKSANHGGKVLAVAWYEKDGIIYSVKSEGMAQVEEKPVLFKWYVFFSIIILIAVTIFRAVRRKA
jgi:hypothetical protein